MDHKFIKNRDIVLFSFQPWDTELGSNFKDIARELSTFNRVLFVNRALDRISLLRNRNNPQVKARLLSIKYGYEEIVEIQPSLWVQNPRTMVESINWIPFPAVHDWLNKINNRRLATQINAAIHQLGFSNVILLNDNDFIRGRYLKSLVHCTDYIFYKRDYLLGVRYFQRHGPRLEAGTLKDADLVVTNSAYLERLAKKFNPLSFDIGQGFDITNYQNNITFEPEDIAGLKKPVIGFTGFVSYWRIDVETITYIARRLQHCSIVLIGPVDELFDMEDVQDFRNIHFLGYKPPSQLPAYLKHFDVCINPQIRNEITRGNYPRKIDEYLAMGKPVVATETEGMKLFKPYCWLCRNKFEFVENITLILSLPENASSRAEIEKRKAFALTHTWESSIGRLGDAYYQMKFNIKNPGIQETTIHKTNWLQVTSLSCLIAYFLFIFIKFLFF
jgi:glycosyltransferase involved in cell wall biosynthesis